MARVAAESADIELDLGRYEVRRRGRRVKLEKKPMELLILLAARREQLVLRQEIVSRLWGSDLFVDTERSINNIVRKIRTALGDHPTHPRFVETVVGKGYRFIGPLRIIHGGYPTADSAAQITTTPQANGVSDFERCSLAVLPFSVLGSGADDSGLSLGFADALIARLGNLRGVDVLPTSSVMALSADATPAEIAVRLGVRFVVRGAIRFGESQSRLAAEVFDLHTQSACFSKRYDLQLDRLFDFKDELALQIAGALKRPLRQGGAQTRPRYSRDPLAYAEFMRGYRLSSSGDPRLLEEATQRLMNAATRDPEFALAHAILSFVCATRHFDLDPGRAWLEKAEFHCRRSLELDPDLPEGHLANAFLLWGPSKNFQHLEAIAELKRALSLQKNLPHAYNRLGTILAHIGLLDQAREMYERGSSFDPRRAVSHSIVQVHVWNGDYELAVEETRAWRAESPASIYPLYFGAAVPILTGDLQQAQALLDEAAQLFPEEPVIASLQGLWHALEGSSDQALDCMNRACASPRSLGHAHHTHYQVACILAVLQRHKEAFKWLERSVDTGFACWPFFLRDPALASLRDLPEFELLISSLQAKYPSHLGVLP